MVMTMLKFDGPFSGKEGYYCYYFERDENMTQNDIIWW